MTRWEGEATVLGPPVTMGSKRAFVNRKTHRAVVVDDKRPELRHWQQAMREEMERTAPEQPLSCAVTVTVLVYLLRPKGHYGSGRNADKLRESAPAYPIGKPDADKILRAVLDCGTGIWFRDDAQVCGLHILKRWATGSPKTSVYGTSLPLGGDRNWAREQEEAGEELMLR